MTDAATGERHAKHGSVMVQRGWVAHHVWTEPPAAVAACCSNCLEDAHSHLSSCSWLVDECRLQTYMVTHIMIGLQMALVEDWMYTSKVYNLLKT